VFPSAEEHRSFIDEIAARGISGGAIYDALVALSARSAGLPLLSRDRRAASTYLSMAIDVTVVE
jgi:toxin FitB